MLDWRLKKSMNILNRYIVVHSGTGLRREACTLQILDEKKYLSDGRHILS